MRLCAHIEDWWGDDLTAGLAARISEAPTDHLCAFGDTLDLGISQRIDTQISPGLLRPLSAPARTVLRDSPEKQISDALRVLLYSHEVAIGSDFIEPIYWLSKPNINSKLRERLQRGIRLLSSIRPLIDDGILHITPVVSQSRHPALSGRMHESLDNPSVAEITAELAKLYEDYPRDNPSPLSKGEQIGVMVDFFGTLNYACYLAERRLATPLSTNSIEARALDSLLGRKLTDGRFSKLDTLVRLPVPNFKQGSDLLVSLRRDEAAFGSWRVNLDRALQQVEAMTDSDDLSDAAAIVKSELEMANAEVGKALGKSPLLQASTTGITKFGLSALSAATTGIMTGNPWVALASGGVVQVADTAKSYLETLRSRRSGRLTLDLIAQFDTTAS